MITKVTANYGIEQIKFTGKRGGRCMAWYIVSLWDGLHTNMPQNTKLQAVSLAQQLESELLS